MAPTALVSSFLWLGALPDVAITNMPFFAGISVKRILFVSHEGNSSAWEAWRFVREGLKQIVLLL